MVSAIHKDVQKPNAKDLKGNIQMSASGFNWVKVSCGVFLFIILCTFKNF